MNTKSGNTVRWWRLAVVALVGVVVMPAASCQRGDDGPPSDQTPTGVIESTGVPETAPDSAPVDSGSSSGEDLPYVPNQLILIGDKTVLDPNQPAPFAFLKALSYSGPVMLGPGSTPYKELTYGEDVATLTNNPVVRKLAGFQGETAEPFVSMVVDLDPLPSGALEILSNSINISTTLPVIASPNYYMTTSQIKVSPWDGRPVSVGADPPIQYDVMRCATMPTRCNLGNPALILGNAANSIPVGVFDSSPWVATGSNPITSNLVVPWNITFTHVNNSPTLPSAPGANNFYDHGVFVAGLIKIFAPEADVRLVKSFNEDGKSTLALVRQEINLFAAAIGSGQPKVVNLSANFDASLETEEERAAFESMLVQVTAGGGIVVVSAGNQTNATYPSNLTSVVKVGGVNKDRVPSCFTNPGDVYAYAGNGQASAGGPCSTQSLTDGTISLVPIPQTSTTDFQLVSWSGTSFATAIISAQAARELEQWKNCDSNMAAKDRLAAFKDDLNLATRKWPAAAGTTVRVAKLSAMDANCH